MRSVVCWFLMLCITTAFEATAWAGFDNIDITQYVNSVKHETDYQHDGDVLVAAAGINYLNNTGVLQTVWVHVELWADDVMLDSNGESTEDIAPGQTKPTSCAVVSAVWEELPDQVEVRVTWGTNALGQVGATTVYFHHDG